MKNQSAFFKFIKGFVLFFTTIIFIVPLFFIFINSFKSNYSIFKTFLMLPGLHTFTGLENYLDVLITTNLFPALINSIFITVIAVFIIMYLSTMAAWMIARSNGLFSKFMICIFVLCALIPFELLVFVLPDMLKFFALDNIFGAILIYIALALPINIFIYWIFIRKISCHIDEAALMDGSSIFGVFFKIILSAIKPIALIMTLINSVFIWNDFFISAAILRPNIDTFSTLIYSLNLQNNPNISISVTILVFASISAYIFYRRYNRRVINNLSKVK
jgi:raffinose/stachyose/melibiose transport system permease protein